MAERNPQATVAVALSRRTDEFVKTAVCEWKVTLSWVAVPAPEFASNVTVSLDAGTHVQLAPPVVADQWSVLLKFPVPPIQKQDPFPAPQVAAASPVRTLKMARIPPRIASRNAPPMIRTASDKKPWIDPRRPEIDPDDPGMGGR